MELKALWILIIGFLALPSVHAGVTQAEASVYCSDCIENFQIKRVADIGNQIVAVVGELESENAAAIKLIAQQKPSSHQPISLRDGPNCFNAALVGIGYTKEVTYTDPAELSFYLNKFCKRNVGAEKPGDVLLITIGNYYMHAALALPSGKIFEKKSSWGREFTKSELEDMKPEDISYYKQQKLESSRYRAKSKSESDYFNGRATSFYKTEVTFGSYRCPAEEEISSDLMRLNRGGVITEINRTNRSIEKAIFLDQSNATVNANLGKDILKLVEKVKTSQVSSEEELFTLTKLISLSVQLSFIRDSFEVIPNIQDVTKAELELKSVISTLKKKQKKNPDMLAEEVLKVISENG